MEPKCFWHNVGRLGLPHLSCPRRRLHILPATTHGTQVLLAQCGKIGASPSFLSKTPTPHPPCNNAWNPSASGTMWEDWGFPIFLVQDADSTSSQQQCWLEHNQEPLSWPLCSV